MAGTVTSDTTLPTTPRHVTFGTGGLARIAEGIAILARAVRLTYGPRGRNVLLERPFDAPVAAGNAERICRGFAFDDPLKDLGARLLQEVLLRTKRATGDGGTVATILFDAMLQGGVRRLAGGADPRALARGLETAAAAALRHLEMRSRPVRPTQLRGLARSIAGEATLAPLITQALEAAPSAAAVIVEPSRRLTSEVVVEAGFRLPRGLASPAMASDTLQLRTRLARPFILIAAYPLSAATDVVPVLHHVCSRGGSLLIVAEGIEGPALATLVANKVQRKVEAAAVCAPGHGGERRQIMEDLAAATGGTVVKRDAASDLSSSLGRAEAAVVSKASTVIEGPCGDAARIRGRLFQIEAAMQRFTSEAERESLERRGANLLGRTAVIRIGGASDPAIGEMLHKAENATQAIKAALRGGVLPGGGGAYIEAAADIARRLTLYEDERAGADLVLTALAVPCQQLLGNAGLDEVAGRSVLSRYAAPRGGKIFDVETGAWRANAILDSALVLRSALHVAASTAALLLTAAVVVTSAPVQETMH